MSYDYLLMAFGRTILDACDLEAAAVETLGSVEQIRARLAAEFPMLRWNADERTGTLEQGGRWFDVSVVAYGGRTSVSVRTSLRQASRDVVEQMCGALGCVAFDGQAMAMCVGHPPGPGAQQGRVGVPFS